MGKINVLSFSVANLIAAGEVVDRPASAIKELIENSIDSGADRISVEIQNGGVTLMRVTDNGCGMEKEDLSMAIRRHATSKIRDEYDLDSIMTLGFRGEALAAISSVSDMRIISKTKDSEFGSMLTAHFGDIVGVTERGCAVGTSIIVENLFANVPARRKFLKRDLTEAMAVTAAVEKVALSRPEIAFRLIVDGNVKLETSGDGNLRNTVYSLFGREFSKGLIEISGSSENKDIELHGFIGRTDNVKATRNYQNFFINGRYVKSKTAQAAIEQAYCSYIPSEKFPCCILFIKMNPSAVDVNVHPAKLEVKFSNEKAVFEGIYYSVRSALEENVTRPDFEIGAKRDTEKDTDILNRRNNFNAPMSNAFVPVGRQESMAKRQISINEGYAASALHRKPEQERITAKEYIEKYRTDTEVRAKGAENTLKHSDPEKPSSINTETEVHHQTPKHSKISERTDGISEQKKSENMPSGEVNRSVADAEEALQSIADTPIPSYRIAGEVFNSYVIVELAEKMLIVDKHAAHERVIFEKLKANMKNSDRASQMLMLPVEVMLTVDEIAILNEYRADIEAVGFSFETGRHIANIFAIPDGVDTNAVPDMIMTIADRIKNSTGSAKLTHDIIFEKALYQASCKAAIKAGREYPKGYNEWLIGELMRCPDITFCPHGRPVALEMSHKNIDRQFERN